MATPFISLVTDYGLEGPYVGVCHGVIRCIVPDAVVVDVSHMVEPYDVRQGAVMLADAVTYLPVGVHVAVVDPRVGTRRRALALRCEDGRAFVGPDNGVLMLAARRSHIVNAVELPAPDSEERGLTFAGRDVFAPAAARLASGLELSELGPELDLASLVELAIPAARIGAGVLEALVVAVDRFGTIQLACSTQEATPIVLAGELRVTVAGTERPAVWARTFADVESGELLVYEDSFGHLAVAVREGSAAALLGAQSGAWVSLRPT